MVTVKRFVAVRNNHVELLVEYSSVYVTAVAPPVFSGTCHVKTTRLFCEAVSATRLRGADEVASGTANVAVADGTLSPTTFTAITLSV